MSAATFPSARGGGLHRYDEIRFVDLGALRRILAELYLLETAVREAHYRSERRQEFRRRIHGSFRSEIVLASESANADSSFAVSRLVIVTARTTEKKMLAIHQLSSRQDRAAAAFGRCR